MRPPRANDWQLWKSGHGAWLSVALVLPGLSCVRAAHSAGTERLVVQVRASHPHASSAFTQGLVWHEGRLFESTGLYGTSSLREVELESGAVLRSLPIDAAYFAEGLAAIPDSSGLRLVQLTWREGRAFEWRADDFSAVRTFEYASEGWGLCHDGEHLVMSDGSNRLTLRDPETFAVQSVVSVLLDGTPQRNLNELECVGGHVYANVWGTDRIVRIAMPDGVVDQVIDASGLLSATEDDGVDVLNGIAYVPTTGRFLLTGKLWPRLFEVDFVAAPAAP